MGMWVTPVVGYTLGFMAILCITLRDHRKHKDMDTEEDVPETENVSKNQVIFGWLQEIGLTEYHDLLVNAGYESIRDIQTITENDLKKLKIPWQVDVKKIMNKINGNTTTNSTGNMSEGGKAGTVALNIQKHEPPPAYYDGDGDDGEAPPAYSQITNF